MYWTIISLCVVLTVCLIIGIQALNNILINNMLKALQKRDYNLYFQILESFPMRIFYAKFNRIYMTLNGAMYQQNKELIDKTVDELLSIKLNKKQANNAYVYVFYHYASKEDKEYSKKILDKIESCCNDNLAKKCKQIYSILVLKEASCISSMKQQLQDCKDEFQQGYLSYMIGLQYEYINDKENSTSYLNKAWDILKETPFQDNIKNLLEEK